jgi:hypothetical protein
MSRFPRLRRRPDAWSDPHERARRRLAERLDGPLGLPESTWLDEHLASCRSCSALAQAYEADRVALRSLRNQPIEPPRDLWARTAASIESAAPPDRSADRARRSVPVGALSGLAVVVVVVGVSLVSGNLLMMPLGQGRSTTQGDGGSEATADARAGFPGSGEPTPMAVAAGDVSWLDVGPSGDRLIARAGIDSVCPVRRASGCAMLDDTARQRVAINARPRTIIGSPTRAQAVAIARTEDAGDELVVVALPEATEEPEPSARPAPSSEPSPTAAPVASATAAPASAAPSAITSSEPTSDPVATGDTSGGASPSPSLSPEPTRANELAIASGIEVIGESAAFSADGTWFAFTARPAYGSGGPDVYRWRVGDESAEPLTTDGMTYFASWSGNELIASRPADADDETPHAATVRIDPVSGVQSDAGDIWRPAVDPSGRFAIGWDGSVSRVEDGTWTPRNGSLELRRWSEDGARPVDAPERYRVATEVAPNDFDVRWDDSSEWVAVWVADERDASVGRLTLYRVDADRERLEIVDGAPVDVAALPGFSIGDGRLAWVTPPGQGGEGSRVQIAAWSEDEIGTIESRPGDEVVVVR